MDDAINRQALYNALYKTFHEENTPNNITKVELGLIREFVKNFPSATPQLEVNRMDSIKFGANLFAKAKEMQTKTVRACDVIAKIDEELSTMPEPFKMDFICLVTRAVDKCENTNNNGQIANIKGKALREWVPASERLPEEGEAVLTVNLIDGYAINHIIDANIREWLFDGVVAWMPLPEPYKFEKEG